MSRATTEPANMSPAKIHDHLARMLEAEPGMMNVAPAEGEYLANLIRRLNAQRALEIGTSNGYSGIWLATALRETGGKLITLDNDEGRHALALRNFAAAGVADIIDSRLTNALEEIPKLEGPFDFVFIDAWKPDYIRYLELAVGLTRPGGIIAAHNVDSHAAEMRDFLDAIRAHPDLATEFVSVGSGGLSVSYRK